MAIITFLISNAVLYDRMNRLKKMSSKSTSSAEHLVASSTLVSMTTTEHQVDTLFAMFWHKEPDIKYYMCTINKTFAKPGQRMHFQVNYSRTTLIQTMRHSWSDLQTTICSPNVA